jgi:cytochrome c-type biogenesis protein CcmH
MAQGSLRDPGAAGRSRTPTNALDNNEHIKEVELRLACPCPCTLDIFTCRTTDFTCTYSPQAHREIVAMYDRGMRGQDIIDAWVAKHGEEALMAPKPEGFNLAGYLVPGVAVTAAGGLLAWYLARRRSVSLEAAGGAGAGDDLAAVAPAGASPEELDRLRRALAEVED